MRSLGFSENALFSEFRFLAKSAIRLLRITVIQITVANLVARKFIEIRVWNFYIDTILAALANARLSSVRISTIIVRQMNITATCDTDIWGNPHIAPPAREVPPS